METPKTRSLLLSLLLGPIQTYTEAPLSFLCFESSSTQSKYEKNDNSSSFLGGNYTDLLFLQPYSIRRQVAHAFAKALLKANTQSSIYVGTMDGVNFMFGEICSIMVRDQVDGGLFGPKPKIIDGDNIARNVDDIPLDWEDALEEQTLLAKLVHVIKSDESDFEHEFLVIFL